MPCAVRLPLDSNYVFALHSHACFARSAAVIIIELHDYGGVASLNRIQLDDTLFGIEATDTSAHLFSTSRVDLFFRLIRQTVEPLRMDYLVIRIARGD